MGDFNMVSGSSSNSNYNLKDVGGQTNTGIYSDTNYKIKIGFQNIKKTSLFAFSISETSIDFGKLSPTNITSRTNVLSVLTGSSNGYSVVLQENHPLSSQSSSIPDTTCDDGMCTEKVPSIWISNLTYGFGYRCDNLSENDCDTTFINKTNYKQFADKSKSEQLQIVMKGNRSDKEKKAQITYRVNVAGAQPPGAYNNSITYIASPNF